jgi:hypothetical protein
LASRIFFCNFILRVKRYRERKEGGEGERGIRERGMRKGGNIKL